MLRRKKTLMRAIGRVQDLDAELTLVRFDLEKQERIAKAFRVYVDDLEMRVARAKEAVKALEKKRGGRKRR
jgi:hypothetical protein